MSFKNLNVNIRLPTPKHTTTIIRSAQHALALAEVVGRGAGGEVRDEINKTRFYEHVF